MADRNGTDKNNIHPEKMNTFVHFLRSLEKAFNEHHIVFVGDTNIRVIYELPNEDMNTVGKKTELSTVILVKGRGIHILGSCIEEKKNLPQTSSELNLYKPRKIVISFLDETITEEF